MKDGESKEISRRRFLKMAGVLGGGALVAGGATYSIFRNKNINKLATVSDTAMGTIVTTYAPWVIKLPDNTYRMYYNIGQNKQWWTRIATAASIDGINWNPEGEIAFIGSPPIGSDYINPCVVLLDDGRYRMYFEVWDTDLHDMKQRMWIVSAVSEDGKNFIMDPGKRINYGGTYDYYIARFPSVYKNDNGTWSMFYYGRRYDNHEEYFLKANSIDGLNWEKENIQYKIGECILESGTFNFFVKYSAGLINFQKIKGITGINEYEGFYSAAYEGSVLLNPLNKQILTGGNPLYFLYILEK